MLPRGGSVAGCVDVVAVAFEQPQLLVALQVLLCAVDPDPLVVVGRGGLDDRAVGQRDVHQVLLHREGGGVEEPDGRGVQGVLAVLDEGLEARGEGGC